MVDSERAFVGQECSFEIDHPPPVAHVILSNEHVEG